MIADVSIAVVKLLLGLLVFAVVGYIGKSYDKRIAGVLLTFPILNGIGILTGNDPLAVANSIYAVVVVNGVVLFLMIAWCDWLPTLVSAPPNVKLVVRLIVWTGIWAILAPLAILWRDDLPGASGLLLLQFVVIGAAGLLFWQPKVRGLGERTDGPEAPKWRHAKAFFAFWRTRNGIVRLLLFSACSALLLGAASVTTSQWLGMLSALPVPGLFAVATLSIIEKRDYFERMRDTVLLGPVSVIAFNWLYVHVVPHLPAETFARLACGIATMALLLLADAVFIFWSTPLVTRFFDRLHAART
ncbi:MAG TPA: hypothetical protein VEJ40_05030 [Pseudolabrys sp.]|nr:hypothetical protein [Pseudolabrys sp.]